MLTAVRPLELGMSDVNKIPFIEECGHDKNLAPNISQNFETTIVSHNNLESVRERVTQRTRPSHTEIDRKIEEEFSLELEDCSEPYTEDIRNVCRRILKRIKEAHEVEICVIFLPTNEVVVIGEKAKTIENEIIQELAHLNLPKIHVGNTNTDFDGFPHVELLSKITKMLLESNEWKSGESAFCELIVSAQDKDSAESDCKSAYAVVPAHFILTAEQNRSLTIGGGDIAQVREEVREQGNHCKYVFKNENQEFDDIQSSSLIAYRYWDRRSTTEEIHNETQVNNNPTEQVTVEWEESSSFMNDVALLKFATDQQLATAEDTEVFPIPTRRHLELLAKRKQRIFVGGLEGTLMHNPETFGCVSKQYGLHMCFVITSRDSDEKICELEKGSSGLNVSFKGRNGQLRPVGMLIGRLTAQVEGLDLSIYQAVVLSQALKEISDDYSLQISDYKSMHTCHQPLVACLGTDIVINQVPVETAVHDSSDSELRGGKDVSTNYSTVKSKMTKQRPVTSEGAMSLPDSGASVDRRLTMMCTMTTAYDKLKQLLTGYLHALRQPDTTELQQCLQAITPEQRYELVTGVRVWQCAAVHRAAFKDHAETISCILDSFTAEVRYKLLKVQGGVGGLTAIHIAAYMGHTEAMRCMLDKVSPEHQIQLLDTKDGKSNTPLDLALQYNEQQTADCIRSYKGTNTLINQMAVETVVDGSSDNGLIWSLVGKGVATSYATVKSEMTKQRAVNSKDSRVGAKSQPYFDASLHERFTMMGAKSSTYDKLQQLLSGYVNTYIQPDIIELQQCLQAVTPEQRYELVTEVRGRLGTSTHRAAVLGHTETLSCILDSFTAEVRYQLLNMEGMGGVAGIHVAARKIHTQAMRCMLDKASQEDLIRLQDTKCKDNNTPLDLALQHNKQRSVDYIRSHKVGRAQSVGARIAGAASMPHFFNKGQTPINTLSHLVNYLKEASHFKFKRGILSSDHHFMVGNIKVYSGGENDQLEFFIYDSVSVDPRKVVLTRNNFNIWSISEPDTKRKEDTLQYNIEKGKLVHIVKDSYPTAPAHRCAAVGRAARSKGHFTQASKPFGNPSEDLVSSWLTGEGVDIKEDVKRHVSESQYLTTF